MNMKGILVKRDDRYIIKYDIRESFHRSIEVHPDIHIPEFKDELAVEFSIESFDDGSLSLTGYQGTRDYAIIHKTNFLDELKQISSITVKRFAHDEEPIAMYVFPSGWKGFYHMIIEWGAYENFEHKFISDYELKEKYPNMIKQIEDKDIVVSAKEAISSNVFQLGENIRKKALGV